MQAKPHDQQGDIGRSVEKARTQARKTRRGTEWLGEILTTLREELEKQKIAESDISVKMEALPSLTARTESATLQYSAQLETTSRRQASDCTRNVIRSDKRIWREEDEFTMGTTTEKVKQRQHESTACTSGDRLHILVREML